MRNDWFLALESNVQRVTVLLEYFQFLLAKAPAFKSLLLSFKMHRM